MRDNSISSKAMIMDADVLIDLIKADRSVLKLFVKHLGPLYAITPVAEEVKDVKDLNELSKLGIDIIEPHIDDAFEASIETGPTSFKDRLNMLTAKRHKLICVTNDKHLRKLCNKKKVATLRGLELLIELQKAGGISIERAINIAKRIHRINPKYINKKVLEAFIVKIKKKKLF